MRVLKFKDVELRNSTGKTMNNYLYLARLSTLSLCSTPKVIYMEEVIPGSCLDDLSCL